MYTYYRTGVTTWTAGAKVLADDATAGDQFGGSVSVHNNQFVVVAGFNDEDVVDGGSLCA